MTKVPKIKFGRRGFTLIELLIVISIMAVLAAIVIPKLRVVTADRKIREAARVVESTFASARDDAVVNGFAGIEIVRNGNYTNGATSMYRMRMLPPYAGDFFGDLANVSESAGVYSVQLPAAASYTPSLNDFIQFNYRGPLYRMLTATTFEVLSYQTAPPLNPAPQPGVPFMIYRKPVRLISGEVRIPVGQLIDLQFSGDHDTSGAATSLNGELNPVPLPAPNTNSFIVIFDQHGAIERYYPQGFGAATPVLLPGGPLFLLIATDEESDGLDPLQNMANLWVTINQSNGAVKVSEMASSSVQAAPFAPATPARLDAARSLALDRRTANQ